MRSTRHPARALPLALLTATLLAVSGCSATGEVTSSGSSTGSPTGETGAAISDERCAQNEAAGEIVYVTGYQYQASASILDVIAAEGLGYFEDLCLDVTIQPGTGDAAGNAQLVAAGTATFTDLGSDSDLLRAVANDVAVQGVLTYGRVPIETLMTSPDITDLTQLDGTVLGHKGQLPATLQAMLVDAGADLESIEQVQVGFDPSVLPRGQVQSLTGYKSNEPALLEAMGEEVTLWNPEDYGIPGSFGTVTVNPAFAEENPTAVEDMLRALLHAYTYCEGEAEECVGFAEAKSEAGYDLDHNIAVWTTESGLVRDHLPAGEALGSIDRALVTEEFDFLVSSGQLPADLDHEAAFDSRYVEAIYEGSDLIWPAP